jgi:cysteine synthase A
MGSPSAAVALPLLNSDSPFYIRVVEMRVADSVLDLIGNTPLVRLGNVAEGVEAEVLVKLEYLNPTGSIKDRVALRMVEGAEERGLLEPGHTIVEASTGNTGTSLSFIGALKGYRVVIYETTPGMMGAEKRKLMMNYGAEVRVLKPEDLEGLEGGVPGAEVELPGRRICLELESEDPGTWWARQFSNPENVLAQNQTGREILEQTGGGVHGYVAAIGTGGTLMGVAEVLKEADPGVRVVGVQPEASKTMMVPGEPYPRSEIEGGIVSDMLERPGLIDEVVRVGNGEAVEMAHRLWREEGLFCGISGGANVLVALDLARELGAGKTVVTVLPDSGDRYLTEEHFVT